MTGPSSNNQNGNGSTHGPKFTSRHKNYYIEGADLHLIVRSIPLCKLGKMADNFYLG